MSADHRSNLSFGSETLKDCVLIDQPRINFDSSSLPSAENFFKEIISFLGSCSVSSRGLAKAWITKGIDLPTQIALSPKSGETPIESSR